MAFQRYNRFNNNRRSYGPSMKPIMRRSGQLTRKFQAKVNRTVQRITPRQRKVGPMGGNPPIFTSLKGMTRTVRVQIKDTQTLVTHADIFNTEASYYGLGSTTPASGNGPSRWTNLKVLSFKAYGLEGISQINISTTEPSDENGNGAFSDYANLNDRAVISVENPATVKVWKRGDTVGGNAIVAFTAGTIELIDFYVQFN